MSWASSPIDNKIDELKRPSAQRPPAFKSVSSPVPSITPPATLSIAKYLEDNLQHILKTVQKTRTLAFMALPKGLRKRPLKAKFSNIYQGKTYIKYYNFC